MIRKIACVLSVALMITSCGSVPVNTALAPPPVAAQAGDAYLEAAFQNMPNSEYSNGGADISPALSIGGGYLFNDLDIVSARVGYTLNQTATTAAGNASFSYQRKMNRTGSIEHFIGTQYQYGLALRTSDTANSHGIGVSYMARINSPGGFQGYGGIQLGAGNSTHGGFSTTIAGTANVGLQYRISHHLEFRGEVHLNQFYPLHSRTTFYNGGLFLGVRYIL